MADTLTENQKQALETYKSSPGWYEYPGVDRALRKQELLDLLDGDEFVDEPEVTEDDDPAPAEEPYKVKPPAPAKKAATAADPSAGPQFQVSVPEVKFGAKHHGVLIVRSLLTLLAYPTSSNPIFDGDLERAVIEFQNDERIPATGEVDLHTWQALLKASRATE